MNHEPGRDALDSLTAFVPVRLVDRLAASGQLAPGAIAEMRVVILLADISNFTGIAERLVSRDGADGAAELVRVLQACLGPMIETASAFGGEVLAIRGDSLMVWWPLDTAVRDRDMVWHASSCAAALHVAFKATPEAKTEGLGLHLGLASGPMLACAVGGIDGRSELVFGGQVVRDACIAMNQAAAGASVASKAFWDRKPDGVEGIPTVNGFVGLTRLPMPHKYLASNGAEAPSTAAWRSYLPGAVWEAQVNQDQMTLLPRMRIVTSLFCRIHGIDPSRPSGMGALQSLVQSAQRVATEYGGVLDRVNVDERGVFLILFFGLPVQRRWVPAGAGMDAAVVLSDQLAAEGFRCSIGLATGEALCSVIGQRQRSHFTCHGAPPNLAARYMEFIENGIACDDTTARAAGERHDFEHRQPASLKGLPVRQSFNRWLRVHDVDAYATRLAGREAEISDLLGRALRATRVGTWEEVALVGPLGYGKTRLVDEFARRVVASGLQTLVLSGRSGAEGRSLAAWHARRIDGRPELRGGDAAFVPSASGQGIVVVLDDAADVDAASAARVRDAVSTIPTGLTVRVLRASELAPASDDGRPTLAPILLGPLTVEGIGQLLRAASGGVRPAASLIEEVHRLTAGHPLLAGAVVEALRLNQLEPDAIASGWVNGFGPQGGPAILRRAGAQLLDALPSNARQLLILLTCADCRCSAEELSQLSPWPAPAGYLESGAGAALDAGLIRTTEIDGTFEQVVPLMRSVVRGYLSASERREIHRRIVGHTWHETSALASLNPSARAEHHLQAGQIREGAMCLAQAAEAAYARGAYAEALPPFERLLNLSKAVNPPLPAAHRAVWLVRIGRCQASLGQLGQAGKTARDALDLLGHPLPTGTFGWLGGLFAGVWARLMPRFARSAAPSKEHAAAIADAIDVFTVATYFSAEPLPLLVSNLFAVGVAEEAGIPEAAARAAAVVGYMCGLLRMHSMARGWFDRTQRACVEAGDTVGEHSTLGGRAMYEIGFARWGAARTSAARALMLCRRAGEPNDIETALTLSGLLEHYAGDFARSLADFARVRDAAKSRGNLQHTAWGAYGMAQNLIVQGRSAEALPLLLEASELLLQVDDRHSDLICSGLLSLAHLHLGDYARARQEVLRAVAVAEGLVPNNFGSFVGYHAPATTLLALWGRALRFAPEEAPALESVTASALSNLKRYARLFPVAGTRLKLLDGWAAQRRGQLALARSLWDAGLSAAGAGSMPYDAGCLHWSLSRLDAHDSELHRICARRLLSQCDGVPLLVEFGSNEIGISQLSLERST